MLSCRPDRTALCSLCTSCTSLRWRCCQGRTAGCRLVSGGFRWFALLSGRAGCWASSSWVDWIESGFCRTLRVVGRWGGRVWAERSRLVLRLDILWEFRCWLDICGQQMGLVELQSKLWFVGCIWSSLWESHQGISNGRLRQAEEMSNARTIHDCHMLHLLRSCRPASNSVPWWASGFQSCRLLPREGSLGASSWTPSSTSPPFPCSNPAANFAHQHHHKHLRPLRLLNGLISLLQLSSWLLFQQQTTWTSSSLSLHPRRPLSLLIASSFPRSVSASSLPRITYSSHISFGT